MDKKRCFFYVAMVRTNIFSRISMLTFFTDDGKTYADGRVRNVCKDLL